MVIRRILFSQQTFFSTLLAVLIGTSAVVFGAEPGNEEPAPNPIPNPSISAPAPSSTPAPAVTSSPTPSPSPIPTPGPTPQPLLKDFEIPNDEEYKAAVQFWIDVYTKYTLTQGVIHDEKYVDRIYETVDFHSLERKQTQKLIKETKNKWRNVLLSVHLKLKNPEKMTDEQRLVFKMFPETEGVRRFVEAASRKRLRFQLGQKDRFLSSLSESGRYLPLMEDIFRSEGLPSQLSRLPFVESSFNLHARSKVGASGIWQFMRTTGRLYLRMNQVVDERNDPIRSTEAAAKLLRQNYESIGNWPLAVVAYNHGRTGIMRAQQKVGSNDIREVLKEYRSRSFGFASRNFYWELVAAIEVEKNSEKYFGKVERFPLFAYTPVFTKHYILATDLAQGLGISIHDFTESNPSFTTAVYEGRKYIPPGYPIRITDEWGKDKGGVIKAFDERYALIPDKLKKSNQR